jgi:putative heme-binding domain-containing protein
MRRALLVGLFLLLAGSSLSSLRSVEQKEGEKPRPVQWIWFNEGDPTKEAPAGTRYFRKTFQIDRNVQKPVDDGSLDITADDEFTVWVNGAQIGQGSDSKRVFRFDATSHLLNGKNVIAVAAKNHTKGPAGLLVRLSYVPNGLSRMAQMSDESWKSAKVAPDGWQKLEFDDTGWQSAKVLGPYGKTEPWHRTVWGSSGNERFTVPDGFRVEMAAQNPDPKDPFSLINLTFDDKGRLLVSNERGGILLCTKPNKDGVFESVKPYCKQVKGCQGMCWVKDALWLTGEGPQGTGMYRVRDTQGKDETDEVALIHKFPKVAVPNYGIQGGMGEHGPHAIIHGPDGWLYLVVGNHAWAKPEKLASNSPLTRWPNGQMGPDQGKPNTTEDVLLPRLNDGRGHASNLLAPGGTIWRFDQEGKNWSLVAAGFRNHFDAAFSPYGELFTFDSDMEWDEALPWYRAVRICHCPPGADFVWRTGSANTPNYYIDSLPPVYETGRGSPVGLEFYDHIVFPAKYRGSYFMADWSLGIIWAVHLKRDGASYKASVEKFCQGAPMNVTDIAVGPDGAIYFTMGGRGSQGGVYRIVYEGPSDSRDGSPANAFWAREMLGKFPQQLSGWSRGKMANELKRKLKGETKEIFGQFLRSIIYNQEFSGLDRVKALTELQIIGSRPQASMLLNLLADGDPAVRAHAVYFLGVNSPKESKLALLDALKDKDALVRRRACEALIRAGIEPPLDSIWPLLAEKDHVLQTAARLVLQRIEAKKWTDRIWQVADDRVAEEAVVALCKTNQAAPLARKIFDRLQDVSISSDAQDLLDYLRAVQLVLVHTTDRPPIVRLLAETCFALFPHKDWRVNRELAILLAYFGKEALIDKPVHTILLEALRANPNDRQQQIHYFLCLRLLHKGWTAEQKQALLAWYDATKTWTGGHSFSPFLENILRDLNPVFTAEDRTRALAEADQHPWAAIALLRNAPQNQTPPAPALTDLYERLMKSPPDPKVGELKNAIVDIVARRSSPESQSALRKIAKIDQTQSERVVRVLLRSPSAEDWRLLLYGLSSSQSFVIVDTIEALQKLSVVPKEEDAVPYRTAIGAAARLDETDRWKLVKLLRHWTKGKQFGAEDNDWKSELAAWAKWFGQAFPKEPALQYAVADKPQESKYKFDELLAFLDKSASSRNGNASRGRAVFEKAQCLKCHKYGKDGEGIGPDLTTVSKRFKRADILESIVYPSKVISDQYRSSLIITKNGHRLDGLAAPQADVVTVLLSDGSKVTLKKADIEQQFASLVSVMPERLLDALSKDEIADLFAFLESEPK